MWPRAALAALAWALVLAPASAQSVASSPLQLPPPHGRCEPIAMPICQGLPYNQTIFPNLMRNTNQEQASEGIQPYYPLIKINCSADIKFFLCSMYAPVCTILDHALPPCRGLCESAKKGCEELMLKFDFAWPAEFDCQRFPTPTQELCVGDADGSGGGGGGRSGGASHGDRSFDHQLQHFHRTSTLAPRRPDDYNQLMNFKCPVQLQMPRDLEYKLRVGYGHVVEDCGAPCYHNVTFFDKEQIRFAHRWVGVWSVVCLLSCLFTLATFLLDRSRFPYPERPIIYMALSYAIVAVVFLVGTVAEEDIACNQAVTNRTMNFLTEKTIKQGTLHDWPCTLSAMVLYYSLLSGTLWWVILTVTWFLSAGLKWGQESIDVKSHVFHTIAWTIPSIMTVIVLIMKKIEGDVLSGVCFVGLWDADSLRLFVLAPLALCLVVGFVFLVLGYSSLFGIRTIMKKDGTRTDKLERLIMRIGIFSLLYLLPALTVLCCLFYEQLFLPDWTQLWQEEICRDPIFKSRWQTPCRYPDGHQPDVPGPVLYVFLAKYFALLLIGIISGFWVWCGKTISTWSMFFARLTGRGPRTPAFV